MEGEQANATYQPFEWWPWATFTRFLSGSQGSLAVKEQEAALPEELEGLDERHGHPAIAVAVVAADEHAVPAPAPRPAAGSGCR